MPEFSLLRPNKAPYSSLPLDLSKPYCRQSQPSLYLEAAALRHDDHTALENWRPKALSINQQLALEALRNVIIDTGRDRVPSREWADAHGGKLPDKDPKRRGDDRTALIKKGLVGADKWTVWLINENKELT